MNITDKTIKTVYACNIGDIFTIDNTAYYMKLAYGNIQNAWNLQTNKFTDIGSGTIIHTVNAELVIHE